MARNSSPAVNWLQYLAARGASMALTAFDVDDNLQTAAFFGRIFHRLDRRHRERAHRHIALAYPEKTPAQIDDLTRRSFEHFMQLVVEIFHTPRVLHRDSWSHRTHLRNLAEPIDLLNSGTPAIFLTGHLGNWEVLGTLLALLGYRCDAIARPLDNPLINDWLMGVRQSRGMGIITKFDASDKMIEVLQSGGVLGFIADQNAGDKGMFVPFFGKLASTYKSIGLLAISQNVPIACGCARRTGTGYHYELMAQDLIRPSDWAGRSDPLYYITARYMRAIETMIRNQPEQYLWMHRRWKSRPRFEREGKPMPESLRRNLQDLPWMNESLMDSLLQPMPPI